MKAAVCREFGKPLVVENIALGELGTNDVKVKIKACAICHSDIIQMDGGWGGNLPAVYGHEAAGIVEETGSGVKNFKAGDHVLITLIKACGHCYQCGKGNLVLCSENSDFETLRLIDSEGNAVKQGYNTAGFAEYTVVDSSQVYPIPKVFPFECAGILSCGVITGFGAVVNTVHVYPGDTVAVIGCGGVGYNVIQGAAISGASQITALDVSDEKLSQARIFGADNRINVLNDDIRKCTDEITDGAGFDFVFCAVGSSKAVLNGIEILAAGGTLVKIGMSKDNDNPVINTTYLAHYGQKIIGSKMGNTVLARDIKRLIRLYSNGKLKLDELISNRYPLEKINEAIAEAKNNQVIRNVVIFD